MSLAVIVLLPEHAATQVWWNSGWTRRRSLILANWTRGETLQNFPVLLELYDWLIADYDRTRDAGQDLRFIDANGTTVLAHEIETWDETGTSYVWFKVPQVDAWSAGIVYLYYGNPSAPDAQKVPVVWSNGYVGVWHLNQDPSGGSGAIVDSSPSPIDGACYNMGATNLVDARIGKGLWFSGEGQPNAQYVRIPTSPADKLWLTGDSTIEAWVNRADDTGTRIVVGRQFGTTWRDAYVLFAPSGQPGRMAYSLGNVGHVETGGGLVQQGSWAHVAGVRAGGTMSVYVDGVLQGEAAGTTGPVGLDDNDVTIGAQENDATPYPSEAWWGMIDEVRISNCSRSAGWIDAQHASMTDGFIYFGPEETTEGLPPPWIHADVGWPDAAGSASHSSGAFTITADGTNIYGANDEFHYVYQAVTGDCEIIARVASHNLDTLYAKAGVMMRENLLGNSVHASSLLSYDDGQYLYYRPVGGDTTREAFWTSYATPCWLRVVREGNDFTAYASSTGSSWQQLGQTTITMASTIYVGMCVSSHESGVLHSATFDNVSVAVRPAAFGLLTPSDLASKVSLTPLLDWEDSAYAQGYALVVDDNPDFSSPVVNVGALSTSSYTAAGGLARHRRYYWRVSATNGMWTTPASNNDFSFWTEGTGERVTGGLVVLYEFEEGIGTVVHDTSDSGAPMDLVVQNPGAVDWASGGVTIDSSTIIKSAGAATKIDNACMSTNEIAIEAWLRPADTSQGGPARIVTLSLDGLNRNFTLGQQASRYEIRLRTTTNNLNGSDPDVVTPWGTVKADLTHVVYTRTSAGQVTCYVDGTKVVEATVTGTFANWNLSYAFGLANELIVDRTWLGSFYLVAIYDRALDTVEVTANYEAGPNPSVGPGPDAGFPLDYLGGGCSAGIGHQRAGGVFLLLLAVTSLAWVVGRPATRRSGISSSGNTRWTRHRICGILTRGCRTQRLPARRHSWNAGRFLSNGGASNAGRRCAH